MSKVQDYIIAVCFILIMIGVYILKREEKYKGRTNGKTLSVACYQSGDMNICTATVKYIINGVDYTSKPLVYKSKNTYIPNNDIELFYDIDNPQDCASKQAERTWGLILIILSILIISILLYRKFSL